MKPLHPRSTRTDALLPDRTLSRSPIRRYPRCRDGSRRRGDGRRSARLGRGARARPVDAITPAITIVRATVNGARLLRMLGVLSISVASQGGTWMRGQVHGVDRAMGAGQISGDDVQRYVYRPRDWRDPIGPAVGPLIALEAETDAPHA